MLRPQTQHKGAVNLLTLNLLTPRAYAPSETSPRAWLELGLGSGLGLFALTLTLALTSPRASRSSTPMARPQGWPPKPSAVRLPPSATRLPKSMRSSLSCAAGGV